ncbi:MAG: thioesterase family protein [Acidimicrobiales bacterium]|nr:thioesterase family protein [Acidimicrobiales bacterium]MDP6299144.1 thioesterase family protein [Acidimicrobiales bacterium]HJM29428.1 thioesterase family protein [Acidimicrobiales bacterium]
MKSSDEIHSFNDLIELEQLSETTYRGNSPDYQWGRVYGGQVVAQGLAAAQNTVDNKMKVHSVHAYFIRGGTSEQVINFEVDLLRDGKSFATRRVVATQSDGAILSLSASFQVLETGPDISAQFDMSLVPSPTDLESDNWSELMERRVIPTGEAPYGHAVWLKLNGETSSVIANELGVAYASDDVPFDAAIRKNPNFDGLWGGETEPPFFGASLDHAVWFHRSKNPYAWQLHVHEGINHIGNRGLATGKVYSLDGTHVATVVQEILQRASR